MNILQELDANFPGLKMASTFVYGVAGVV